MSSRIPANISADIFDVIIIGAGINGAGIARDAAMRGLQVLLIDKGDIGGGTSSWSTRLIHGGLRYLEHGEFGLVRESLRERETLLRIAPHLVRPLPLLLPIYDNARRGLWTIRAGMIAYDLLSFDKSLARHRILSRAAVLKVAPGLNAKGLRGAAVYHDAQIEFAERLVMENALSAQEHSASVVTYARVETFDIENRTVRGVEFTDLFSDQRHHARGRIVINAAGPWVDRVLTGVETERLIGGTKGSHIIVAPFAGAPTTALYLEAESDHRPFFIIPWNGNYLIGTTDSQYEGDLDTIEIEASEIDYLLRETNRVVPEAKLTRDSILYTYSGVRPLPYTRAKDEQSITRRHFIRDHAPQWHNLFSIVGGKLTTYRSLAEQTVDLVFRKLRLATPPCTTGAAPLPGAETSDFPAFCEHFKTESGLPAQASERLLRIYGTRAPQVLELAAKDPGLAERLSNATGAIAAEVVFAFQYELAQTLTDCLFRRTMLGLSSSVGVGADEAAASIAQEYLGWSERRAQREVKDYRKHIRRFHPRSHKATDT
jgi:glycerol-3-phosphate dehydrogenase